jgi:NADH-quinone oxidoreductase subunit N
MKVPEIDLSLIAPEIVIALFGLGVLVIDVFSGKEGSKKGLGYVSLVGILIAFFFTLPQVGVVKSGYAGMYVSDGFAVFFKIVFQIIAFLTILISIGYTEREGMSCGEYYALVLFATLGMMLMTGGAHFLTIFLGLETMSISIYVLAGMMRQDRRSVESAFKYFLLGAFATGFLLYGIALVYGATGSLNLKEVAAYIASNKNLLRSPMLLMSLVFLTIGFGFKIASVPFHMWAPDVYEGAPTSITAFMATGVKAASFGALVRVFFSALPLFLPDWTSIMWVLALATMTVGNIIAISQTNIKRTLAYSSIAHAGYLLVAFVAEMILACQGCLYLMAYAFMNLGAFACVILLGKKGEENILIRDYAGIGFKYPLLAASMTIFLLSMAGIPPLGGFMAKFYVFSAAVKSEFYWLAILGVLNSAISVYYYLRVTVLMYFRESERRSLGSTSRLPVCRPGFG